MNILHSLALVLTILMLPGAQPAMAASTGAPTQEATTPESASEPCDRGFLGFLYAFEGPSQLAVMRLYPSGSAERAGLVPGDRVVAVNGSEFYFRDEKEAGGAFDWVCRGDRVQILVLRQGSELSVDLEADPVPPAIAEQRRELRAGLDDRAASRMMERLLTGEALRIERSSDGALVGVWAESGEPQSEIRKHLISLVRAGRLPILVEQRLQTIKPGESKTLEVRDPGEGGVETRFRSGSAKKTGSR